MKNLKYTICIFILCSLFTSNRVFAEQFDPNLTIASNVDGIVDYSVTEVPFDASQFFLFGDGFFGNVPSPTHKFEESNGNYVTHGFFNKVYDPIPPESRTVNTGGTIACIGANNSNILIDSKIDVLTSWSPCYAIENYFMVVFENTGGLSNGVVEFYYKESEISLDPSEILEYDGWVGDRSVSSFDGSDLYDKKIKWEFSDLDYEEQRVIYIRASAMTPTQTIINLGTRMYNDKKGLPAVIPISNTPFLVKQRPHDPNTKMVTPDCILTGIAQKQLLTYTLTFQNEGYGVAVNVRLEDMIDPNLDISSINIIDSEYPYTVNVSEGRLIINFDNIFLPGLKQSGPKTYSYDQTESWITFTIETNPFLSETICISNSAEIYFDFEPAIYTNTVTNCASSQGCESAVIIPSSMASNGNDIDAISNETINEIDETIVLYPNPAQESVHIKNINFEELNKISLINIMGQKVPLNIISKTDKILSIDVSSLQNGIYFIELEGITNNAIHRLVKE